MRIQSVSTSFQNTKIAKQTNLTELRVTETMIKRSVQLFKIKCWYLLKINIFYNWVQYKLYLLKSNCKTNDGQFHWPYLYNYIKLDWSKNILYTLKKDKVH